jgi:hypothetical protein
LPERIAIREDSLSFFAMKKGDTVKWQWGNGTAKGTIEDSFRRRVQRTLKGTKVVKNGSGKNPAYLIEQDDGDQVLKLKSEVEKVGN